MSVQDPRHKPRDHNYLKRLPPEYYRGQAYVHWSLTIEDRATGWLISILYYKYRELLAHTMFRFGLCCPIYCCMPDRCREYLARYRVRLHPAKSIISRNVEGARFLGFRVFPTHRLLPRENLIRLRQRLRAMQAGFANGEVDLASIRRRLVSWLGHAQHANTARLQADVLDDTIFTRAAARAL